MSLPVRILIIVAVILGAALLLFLGYVGYRFWKVRKEKEEREAEAPPEVQNRPEEVERLRHLGTRRTRLRQLFTAELRRLKQNSTGSDYRYRVPWCLVLGGTGVGQSTALANTGMHSPFVSDDEALSQEAGCHFWYFDKGIAIDVDGVNLGDETTFGAVLQLLRRERPKRPLDSLILLIPATDLSGPGKLDPEVLKEKAEDLYQRLQQLQKALSIRVPVYVLISKADKIPGFIEYCGALSAAHREQIFGWSSPHEPEVPYASAWVDEAFGSLYLTESLMQVDLLAAGKISTQERDAAFLFPRNVLALAESTRVFLDQLFKSSVYNEPSLFRGVYFCGDVTVEGVMARASADRDGEGAKHPSFLHHLLSRKIFPEHGLARPLSRSLASGSVMVAAAKWGIAAAVVLSIVLLSSSFSGLEKDSNAIVEFLDRIPNDGEAGAPDRERYARRAQVLLGAMGNVSTSKLARFRVPTSWFSSVDDQVRQLMRDSFESVVLSGLHYGLEYKARQLFGIDVDSTTAPAAPGAAKSGAGAAKNPQAVPRKGPEDPYPEAPEEQEDVKKSPALPKVVSLPNMPEYQDLRAMAATFSEFSRYVELYNNLGTARRKRMDTVGPLVKYVFQTDLGDVFTQNSSFFENALASATYKPFDMVVVTPKVRDRALAVDRALSRRLFVENPIELELSEIGRHISRLKSESEWGGADLMTLIHLRDVILKLERDLDRQEMAWLAKDNLDLGEPYREMIASLSGLAAGTAMTDDLREEWRGAFKQLKRKLFEHQLPVMGALLLKDTDKGKLEVAPPLLALRTSLDGFLSQNYVQMAGERVPFSNPDGSYRVTWNEDLLRQAIALSDAYGSFTRDRLGQTYEVIRDGVKNTALDRLGRSMPSLVGQARRVERISRPSGDTKSLADEVVGEVNDLKRASELLRQILETYDRLGLKSAKSELYQQVQEDTREILRRLDLLLEKDDTYRVAAKLSQWRGAHPPPLDAFDVDDADALAQYIKAQRARMKYWARDFAKTPVALLEALVASGDSSSSEDPLFLKWQRIVTELDHFEKMTPGNSVKELESFIDTTLMSVTPDNCLDRLPRRSGENPDFFLLTRARIYDAVRKRCVKFSEERLLDGYERLAKHFNKDLAGRFPFSRGLGATDDEEADPRDVRSFFQDFDEYVAKYDPYMARNEPALMPAMITSAREIGSFLDSVRAVRPFFVPLVADKSGDIVPRYSMGVEFRVKTQTEINGNQIADFGYSVADQRIDDPQAIWQLGDKIRLTFRWAKDGPYRPSANNQPRGAQLDKNDAISFEWAGKWALIRFLRQYKSQPNDLRKTQDRQPHIIKFPIEIEEKKKDSKLHLLADSYYAKKGAAPTKEETPQTRNAFLYTKAVVFVRITITLPESKEPIVLLSDWPATAPPLRGADWK